MAQLFSFISDPFANWLADLALLVGSAGLAIIFFTIIVRLVLSPLQIVQLRSARAMQKLQPHIQELRKKHGKDRQKMTEETMKLYKEHKVNPAMGCLPMLLQFPILIGLFWALSHLGSQFNSAALKHTRPFRRVDFVGWLHKHPHGPFHAGQFHQWQQHEWLIRDYHHSLHVYDLFHATFLWLSNGLGQHDPLYILPILAGVTQWIQSRMMMQQSSDPQQQTMNLMMNFTPLIIVFFAANYASGLSLYWVTSTVIGILVSMKITGWGSLPRIDRMMFGQAQPARSLVSKSSSGSRSAKLKRETGESNGSVDGNGDVQLSSEDVIVGEAPEQTDIENGGPGGGSSRPIQRRGKRRGGRQRGGRRG